MYECVFAHVLSSTNPFVFDDFANVDGCLSVLSEVTLLLEQEALPAVPTQLCKDPYTPSHMMSNTLNWIESEIWLHSVSQPFHLFLTRLRGVVAARATGGALFEAADGDGLVYNEKSADHVPLTGPQ